MLGGGRGGDTVKRDWSDVSNFTREEWGSEPNRVAWELILLADRIRDEAGVPFNILNSWAQDGHSEKSFHYTGQAVDFYFGGNLLPFEQFALLSSYPEVGGLGWYPGWKPKPGWHIDIRRQSPRIMWTRIGGVYHYGWADLARSLTTYSGWVY